MGKGIIRVTPNLLRELLQLPPTTRIDGYEYSVAHDALAIRVEDPRLPAMPEGAVYPDYLPIHQKSILWPWEGE